MNGFHDLTYMLVAIGGLTVVTFATRSSFFMLPPSLRTAHRWWSAHCDTHPCAHSPPSWRPPCSPAITSRSSAGTTTRCGRVLAASAGVRAMAQHDCDDRGRHERVHRVCDCGVEVMKRKPRPRAIAPLQAGWLIVDGRPVFHRSAVVAGEQAPAIVHVHGFGISGTYMQPTAAILAPRFRTFVPDLPGHGRSMRLEEKMDLPRLARALVDYCDAVGVEKATFVGNSLGCPIICALASDYPERIERAVLVSPAGGPNNQPLAKALGQMALDGPREPMSMVPIAVRDYLHFGVFTSLLVVQGDDPLPHHRAPSPGPRPHARHRGRARSVGQPRSRFGLHRHAARARRRGSRRPRPQLQRARGRRCAHRGAHRRCPAAHRLRPPRNREGTTHPLVMPAG